MPVELTINRELRLIGSQPTSGRILRTASFDNLAYGETRISHKKARRGDWRGINVASSAGKAVKSEEDAPLGPGAGILAGGGSRIARGSLEPRGTGGRYDYVTAHF